MAWGLLNLLRNINSPIKSNNLHGLALPNEMKQIIRDLVLDELNINFNL